MGLPHKAWGHNPIQKTATPPRILIAPASQPRRRRPHLGISPFRKNEAEEGILLNLQLTLEISALLYFLLGNDFIFVGTNQLEPLG